MMACTDHGLRHKSLPELYRLLNKADTRHRNVIEQMIRKKKGQLNQLRRNGGSASAAIAR
jgi:hypothetical protein